MSLKKPPLIEFWISFRFEPNPNSPAWSKERFEVFFNSVGKNFPNVERMIRQGIQISRPRRDGTTKIKNLLEQVLAMRATSENELRTVQLDVDELTFSYLRGDIEPYPGFDTLLSEAMTHCQRYQECYHPIGISEAALHYVDIVAIPVPENGIIKSEEYFTLDFRFPHDTFGTIGAFEIKLSVRLPGGTDQVHLIFASMPARAEDRIRQFRLEWHTPVKKHPRMTEEDVRLNLQAAHDRLTLCFKHAFTDKGWALFEPEES